MAVINYSDQFKYSGKGYIDAKVAPVANIEDLTKISSFVLAKYYTPGMVVMVLDDGLGEGPAQYILTEDYSWEKYGSIDLGKVEERVDAVEGELKNLDSRIKDIASKADENANGISNLNSKIEKIAGIDKLKAGDNIAFVEEIDGSLVISASVPDVDLTEVETRISEIDEAYKKADEGLSERINSIAGNVSVNTQNIEAISARVSGNTQQIQDVSKKVGTLEESFNEYTASTDAKIQTISGDVITIQDRLDSITSGEGDVAVDGITIQKDENKKLSVKISNAEDNVLVVNEDGLYSTGISLSGDDLENEIL